MGLTLRSMISKVERMIKARDDKTDVVKYFNKAIEELNSYCIIPGCTRKLKNFHGQRIHLAKAHGMSKKVLEEIIRVSVKQPKHNKGL